MQCFIASFVMEQILWLKFGSLHTITWVILPFLTLRNQIKSIILEGSRPNTTRRAVSIPERVMERNFSLLRKMMRRWAFETSPSLISVSWHYFQVPLCAQILSQNLGAQRWIPHSLSCLGLLKSTGTHCSSPTPALRLAPCKLPPWWGKKTLFSAPVSDLYPIMWSCVMGTHTSLPPCTGCDAFPEHTRWIDTVITPTNPKKGKVGGFSPSLL